MYSPFVFVFVFFLFSLLSIVSYRYPRYSKLTARAQYAIYVTILIHVHILG
jgi:hypothetical protein